MKQEEDQGNRYKERIGPRGRAAPVQGFNLQARLFGHSAKLGALVPRP